MNDGLAAAFNGLECPLDLLLAALGQNLHQRVRLQLSALHELAKEIILNLAGGGETDLDLAEAQL